ncbi:hypothetical protein jhhlp_008079 [Lomentospora prolificans]|uniref:FAD dependent oxidoreductase domain-containing protein n=1 Tax=Lomentospora prolificans TaxID=41688 RepID=A0A2N3MZH3_9PEZI|nr:hypothetical protein jhhlp_008079 [Lomentospora prolificans]
MLPTPKPTQSYWTRTPIPIPDSPPPPSLPDSSETTILILGTGISAVSAAYSLLALTPATTRLLVLDARSPCDGATGRNGGHCKLVPHEELAKLTKRFGEESAVELVRFQMRHLECLRAICRLVDDEVARDEQEERGTEFRDVETVDIYLGKELFEEAKEKVERLRTAMPDVHVQVWEPTEARERFGVNALSHGAISYPAGAVFPYRLVTNLWTYLVKTYPSRVTILPHTPVISISASSSPPLQVHTPNNVFSAHHVIHTTNAYATHLLPNLKPNLTPVRAHMTAQSPGMFFPAPDVPGSRSWSIIYSTGFDYVTQRPASSQGDLLIGGGWARSALQGQDAVGVSNDGEVDVYTIAHLTGILPALFSPNWGLSTGLDSVWSGIIAVTGDGLPFVGQLTPAMTGRPVVTEPTDNNDEEAYSPQEFGEWIAAGYNGEGMVYAWLCASALAIRVAGQENIDREPRTGVPGGRLSDWFPAELWITELRLQASVLSSDPALVFSPPVLTSKREEA